MLWITLAGHSKVNSSKWICVPWDIHRTYKRTCETQSLLRRVDTGIRGRGQINVHGKGGLIVCTRVRVAPNSRISLLLKPTTVCLRGGWVDTGSSFQTGRRIYPRRANIHWYGMRWQGSAIWFMIGGTTSMEWMTTMLLCFSLVMSTDVVTFWMQGQFLLGRKGNYIVVKLIARKVIPLGR